MFVFRFFEKQKLSGIFHPLSMTKEESEPKNGHFTSITTSVKSLDNTPK